MADKPEFVDMIGEATRQVRRRVMPRVVEPEIKEKVPSQPLAVGSMAAMAPGDAHARKLKSWKFRNWD